MTNAPANSGQRAENAPQGLHVVAKPIGPACNLSCEYCFYLEKQALYGAGEDYRMSDEVLAAFIRNYLTTQPTPIVEFVWQGGEPTLLGIDFFKRVIELQQSFAGTKTITNALQTNGTLLTDEWCRFLKQNSFMVGISIDGPQDIHDRYRRDRAGNGHLRPGDAGAETAPGAPGRIQRHGQRRPRDRPAAAGSLPLLQGTAESSSSSSCRSSSACRGRPRRTSG